MELDQWVRGRSVEEWALAGEAKRGEEDVALAAAISVGAWGNLLHLNRKQER